MKRTIGIIDADLLDNGTRHPNLALMKLSGYYKNELKYDVELLDNYYDIKDYEKVFISKVFSFTKVPESIVGLNNIIIPDNVEIGGTGFYVDGGMPLPDAIEHYMPDYTLYNEYIAKQLAQGKNLQYYYDYMNFSIGFTTRGCFRKCDFCVNKKYSRVQRHSYVNEFFDASRYGIYLWDDNFFGYDKWEEVIEELDATGKPFQFRQGLDIRLLNHRKAEVITRVKYHGDFIFAFDHLEDRALIEKNLALWREYTQKTTKLYVLCAYDSQDEKDIISVFERIKILMKYGCLPYIMRYEAYKESRFRGLYIQLARWCNQPQFFKKKSFREFCEANQAYHKNKNTLCSSYRAMLEFESEFPEIACQYFDLKYENENMFRRG